MHPGDFWRLHDLADETLEHRLRQLVVSGTHTEARVVAHLAEVEARNLHLVGGHESLYSYCTKALGLSGNEAFYRIVAARMASRFPLIFSLLEGRELFITTLPLLRDYISTENHAQLLAEVRGKSKIQVLELLASREPRPDARSQIRKLPPNARSVTAGPTGTLEPLSAATYRLQLNTSHALKEKLELARDLMSHSNPTGDLSAVIERGLDLLIAQLQARRFGQTSRPRSAGHVTHAPSPSSNVAGAPQDRRGCGDGRGRRHSDPDARTPHPVTVDADASPQQPPQPRAPQHATTPHPHFERSKSHSQQPPAPAQESREGNRGQATTAPPTKTETETDSNPDSRPPRAKPKRPHISHETRREVVARDGLRCAYLSPSGKRCEARAFLQFEHSQAFALGGSNEVSNLQLFCARHNRLKAEQTFGTSLVSALTGTDSGG